MNISQTFRASGEALMQLNEGERQFAERAVSGLRALEPRIAVLKAAWQARRAERRERRQIVRELSTYTDRELLDLGFSRADFPAILNGTYRR